MDYTKCVRDLQRKGSEDGRSSPKSSDYKIAQIVVDREIPEHVLSGFQRAKAGKEDVEEKFQALFNVWKIIHMKATTNEGQPVPSVGQETPILIPDTDERDVTESEPCINPIHPLDERNALEDQALCEYAEYNSLHCLDLVLYCRIIKYHITHLRIC